MVYEDGNHTQGEDPAIPDVLMADNVATLLIVVPPILGLLWSVAQARYVAKKPINGHPGLLKTGDSQKGGGQTGGDTDHVVEKMKEISGIIADGANSFLMAEYKYMAVYVVVFSVILYFFVGTPTTIAFVLGSITSIISGYIGMRIAVFTNVRTAHECWLNLTSGYAVAVRGGSVMGFSLVSIGVINLFALIWCYTNYFDFKSDKELYEAVAGYGLGGSSIALFGRVGGGIYTKAADVGADLSGKNEYGMDEDDPRNPACIADNVGDNVGDIAGMGADLFGSFAEATCAALVIAATSQPIAKNWAALMYPLLISSLGVVVGLVTMLIVNVFYPVRELPHIEKALKGVLVISTVLMTPVVCALSYYALPKSFELPGVDAPVEWTYCACAVMLGLWSGLIIGYITEYYTSHSYKPVREISATQKVSAATGIIYGLALGYLSCIVPVFCLLISILVAHSLCGMYGVALAALGMLSTLTLGLTIDAYGPISDNAGGIAEMSELGMDVRKLTDALDAAGNTTAAIGKGFAIGSAALVSLALFGAFTVRADLEDVNVLNPWVFTGLLYGAMMPYAFAAWTMKSVGMAADDMVKECMEQFPKIISGEMKPQYARCIVISTEASLREMLAPGALVILSPLVAGICFGKNTTAGLLAGSLVSSVQLAISMSNTGGAWDNSKKYIEAGGLGPQFAKGSAAHKNAVTGDTVGDPLKDTSGPALNIVMKLTAIMSLVFGSVIAEYSNKEGGPVWLKA